MAANSERKEAGGAGQSDPHIDEQSGERVPTADPKDQTGDPDEPNPAMRELRQRQNRGEIHEA